MAAGKSKKKSKKQKGSASTEILEAAHNIWLAGLGSVRLAEQEGGKLFRSLVERGREVEAGMPNPFKSTRSKVEGTVRDVRDKASSAFNSMENLVDEHVVSALGRLGVPTTDEIAELSRRLEDLTRSVLGVESSRKAAAKKKSHTKTGRKKAAKKKPAGQRTTEKRGARRTTARKTAGKKTG